MTLWELKLDRARARALLDEVEPIMRAHPDQYGRELERFDDWKRAQGLR